MELKAYAKYAVTDDSVRFPIPFDYLSPKYVKVMVEDEPLQYIIDYSVEKREIVLNVPPKKDSVLVVYRETPTSRIVTWNDGSILKASDMTIQEIQMLHILEEQSDFNVLGTIRETETGEWNAKGKRIVNVADPIDPQDVVTKRYFEDTQTGYVNKLEEIKEQAQTASSQAREAQKGTQMLKDETSKLYNNTKESIHKYEKLPHVWYGADPPPDDGICYEVWINPQGTATNLNPCHFGTNEPTNPLLTPIWIKS